MTSHHHGCCHPPTTATSAAVCCSCSSCSSSYNYGYATLCHNPPPPDPHFHHRFHPSTQHHPHCSFPNSPCAPNHSFHPLPADFQREDYFRELYQHRQGGVNRSQPVISSLLRRIAALESSIRHHAASRSQSLRDAAARTIQTNFRAFLVRRSRTLRQLRDLASIKSAINVLKSSVSDNNPLDPLALSHKALQLLLKLDSIQGDDPMIRDGKKSIDAELTRFLDFIDGITAKRSEFSSGFVRKNARQGEPSKKPRGLYNNKKMNNRDLGRDKRLEDLVNRIEALYSKVTLEEDEEEEDDEIENPRISLTGKDGIIQSRKGGGFRKGINGNQAKVNKNVKFSEDRNVYYVPRNRNGVEEDEEEEDDEIENPRISLTGKDGIIQSRMGGGFRNGSNGNQAKEVKKNVKFSEDDNVYCGDDDDGTDLLDAKKKLHFLEEREAEEVEGISCKDDDDEGDEVTQSDDEDDSNNGDGDVERVPTFSAAPLPVRMEARTDFVDKRKSSKLI